MIEVKNFIIDIDGTISEDIPNEEPERMPFAEPFLDARDKINEWFDTGHIITYFTARTDEHKEVTIEWLQKHGFKYHYIIFNKPRHYPYVYIDNKAVKAVTYRGKFTDLVRKVKEIDIFEE